MKNKVGLAVFTFVILILILTFIIIFAIAGGMYLLGNILMGWTWLPFNICFGISGILTLTTGIITMLCLIKKIEKKEDD